jgi:hypothetical protein
MDEHFHNVSFTIINRFFDNISVQSNVNKDSLWAIWNDMYKFPIKADKKESKETKKKTVKPVPEATKPETKPASPVPLAASEPDVVASEPIKRVEVSAPAPVATEHTETIVEKPVKPAEPVKKEVSPSKDGGCIFILTRGERAGKECGKPISKKKSETYCAVHCK